MTARPFVLALTGSIGMGKSTTARLFADEGIPVWDADAAVHRLYGPGGAAVEPIRAARPAAVVEGAVDRVALKTWIAADPGALARIEAVVHPLVAQDRALFLDDMAERGAPLVVIDVPLLFETGGEAHADATLVVTAPAQVQRARVLARPGMTQDAFDTLVSKQMPDAEKRVRADYIIETTDMDRARAAVRACLERIRRDHA